MVCLLTQFYVPDNMRALLWRELAEPVRHCSFPLCKQMGSTMNQQDIFRNNINMTADVFRFIFKKSEPAVSDIAHGMVSDLLSLLVSHNVFPR